MSKSGIHDNFGNRQLESGNEPYDDEVSLQPLLRLLWVYWRVIAVALAVVVFGSIAGAVGLYELQPAQRQASLEFRLIFEGADRDEYPNGLAFSRGEIISTSVMTEVYETNNLQRYCEYEVFKNAIFVLESNAALGVLAREYERRLADPTLTPLDRTRLERELHGRREALRRPHYSLTFTSPDPPLPDALIGKVLNDILTTWAEHAADRKGALGYQLRMYTPDILLSESTGTEERVVRLDILRTEIARIIENTDQLAGLPGANLIQAGKEGISLPEVRAKLDDILRFNLQPLITTVQESGLSKDPGAVRRYLESRLFQAGLQQREAVGIVTALEESLRSYLVEPRTRTVQAKNPEEATVGTSASNSGAALMPQLSDSFLDRLVSIATGNADFEYRQDFTERIIEARRAAVKAERDVAYYEELVRSMRRPRTGSADVGADVMRSIDARIDKMLAAVKQALEHTKSIYAEVSSLNLDPRTNLFTVTSPFTISIQRALTLRRILVYVFLVIMVALIVVSVGCLLHHFFRKQLFIARGESEPLAGMSEKASAKHASFNQSVGV